MVTLYMDVKALEVRSYNFAFTLDYRANAVQAWITRKTVYGWDKKWSLGWVNFVPAVADHIFLNFPRKILATWGPLLSPSLYSKDVPKSDVFVWTFSQGVTLHLGLQSTTLQNCCVMGGGCGQNASSTLSTFPLPCRTSWMQFTERVCRELRND